MDHRLLTAAAILAALSFPSASAAADHSGGFGMHGPRSPRFVDGSPAARDFGRCGDFRRDRHDGRRHRSDFACDGFAYADGEWALYNNRTFEPDSYNDWWNDRPDRAYPRWVQEQRMRGSCDPDRMWWSGSGWHC
jgi:hypothetical protein